MAEEKYDFTSDGIQRLKEELDQRRGEERGKIAEKIKTARAFGDLSENSEYDDAKDEQAKNESRIAELEDLIKNANVIEDHEISDTTVGLGNEVVLEDQKNGDKVEFTLVSQKEEDIFEHRVSNESPVGAAIYGQDVGDVVKVTTSTGIFEYKIVSIE